jgi:integrase
LHRPISLAEQWLVQAAPAQVKSPRATLNKEPEYLTTDETRRLIEAIDLHSIYALRDLALLWALACGLRVGEVAAADAQPLGGTPQSYQTTF